jgi:hypothetical protein
MLGISRAAERLANSQEKFSEMEMVSYNNIYMLTYIEQSDAMIQRLSMRESNTLAGEAN